MPLAWSYARTSTTRQAGADRSGMDRQEAALARWLLDHPTYHLQEALVDAGVSAGKGRHRTRGALGRFLAAARAGAIPHGSVLVVESMTRFSREVATDALGALLELWRLGLAISFTTDGAILDKALMDAEDHRLHGLVGAIGQARREWEERSRRSRGAIHKREQQQDAGAKPPGRCPWWIRRAADGWALDPAAAASVRRVVALATEGLGRIRIAQALTAEGIPGPRGATVWTATQVQHVLDHPALDGTLHRRAAADVLGFYPAVITAAEKLALDAARAGQRDRHTHAPATTQCRNLFQGMSRCHHCGGIISYIKAAKASRAGHPGYVWCSRAGNRIERCPGGSKTIEAGVWEASCLTRLSRALWADLLADPAAADRVATLRGKVQSLEAAAATSRQRLENLERRAEALWADGGDPELLATATRATTSAREAAAGDAAAAAEAAAQLAAALATPSGDDVAADLAAGIQAFMAGAAGAGGEERLRFNRWLLSRRPRIQFLLDAPGQRLALQVGDQPPAWQPIHGDLALAALEEGRAEVTYTTSTISAEAIHQAMARIEAEGLSGDDMVEVAMEIEAPLEPGFYAGRASLQG